MKRNLALSVVLLAGLSGAQQKPGDSVVVDPDHHRVVLENEHLRVIEARASRGAASQMHSHPPFVFISLDAARGKFGLPDGKSMIFDTNPNQVVWFGDGLQHSWELIGGEVNVIGVEIKSAAPGGTKPAPVVRRADDCVTVDPDVHHVMLENDHVRVFEARASKGRKSPMHSHVASLLVVTRKARMKGIAPNGNTGYLDFTPNQVLWFPNGMQHGWEVLEGELGVVVVEVKSAHKNPAPATPAKAD